MRWVCGGVMGGHEEPVLITGCRGVMGRALMSELESAGYGNVTSVSRREADLTDVSDAVSLLERVRPTLVFHLAAKVYGIMGNRANRAAGFLDNIRMNTNVIDAAHRVGVQKIIAMGSVAAYPDGIDVPMRESDLWMGAPHESEAPYAHAKRAMYAQLEAYEQEYGFQYAYCIATNLYGPHDRFDEEWGHVIPSLISKFHRAARSGDSVTVWGSGQASRDFLYSADAARALRIVAEKGRGAINVASGRTCRIREAVELLKVISGYDGDINWDTSKPEGQRERRYDVSQLGALGYATRWDLEDGLRSTYNWFSENTDSARR